MIPICTPVVVTNPELGEIYNAILAEDWHKSKPKWPLVIIQTIIRYPIQTAILWPDNHCDNAPLKEGQLCRMKVIAIRSTAKTMQTYEQSFERALLLATEHARQHDREDCLTILERHAKGIFNRKRAICDK